MSGGTKKNVCGPVLIGAFHELPDGEIAMPYGYINGSYMYYTLDKKGVRKDGSVDKAEADKTWILRKDVTDFPTTRDPRLPHEFDLHWDIKYQSELKNLYHESTGEEKQAIKNLMDKYGIKMHSL